MKHIHSIGLAATLSTLPALSLPAHAESLRCNGQLTEVGDSRLSVLYKCGEPVLRDSHCAAVFTPSAIPLLPAPAPVWVQVPAGVVPCLQVDEWLYDRGPGNLMATVRFQSGVVQAIQYGRTPR